MRTTALLLLALTLPAWGAQTSTEHPLGPAYQSASKPAKTQPAATGKRHELGSVRRWNQIAIDASGLDHTPVAPGELRRFGEQLGPGRASRAMAIVHVAIFDCLTAVSSEFESYTGVTTVRGPLSIDAAVS